MILFQNVSATGTYTWQNQFLKADWVDAPQVMLWNCVKSLQFAGLLGADDLLNETKYYDEKSVEIKKDILDSPFVVGGPGIIFHNSKKVTIIQVSTDGKKIWFQHALDRSCLMEDGKANEGYTVCGKLQKNTTLLTDLGWNTNLNISGLKYAFHEI
jgi:hypothetical protein